MIFSKRTPMHRRLERLFGAAAVIGLLCSACSGESTGGSPSGPDPASGGSAGSSSDASAGGALASGGSGGVAGSAASSAGSSGASGSAQSGGTGGGAGSAGGGGTSDSGGSGGSGGSAGSAGSGGSGGTSSEPPTFHVFLLLGQSNMAGYSKAQDVDKVENPRIKVLGFDDCAATGRVKDQWDIAAPPLHECWNGALGPGDYFAKTMIDVVGPEDTIGLVPCAISGEKIETFQKVGGSKYSFIVDRAKIAQKDGGVIRGILFHQGESNCTDATWPGKVKTLVSDLRNDLGLGEAPFLAGELPYSGNCSGHNQLVNQLPGLIPNAFVVSAAGLAVDPADTQWNLHFDRASQVTLGQRYAEKMKEALGY
jgi:hypothetical protein